MLAKLSALCRTEDIVSEKKVTVWEQRLGVDGRVWLSSFELRRWEFPATAEPLEFWWSNLWRVFSSFVTNSDYPRGKQ